MRVKAVITYDGSLFFGFQRQKSTPLTITHAIETALRSLQIHSPITGSGRTDAGVHASGQVIHFDLPLFWTDMHKLKVNLNHKLKAISFKHITPVSNDFHARFSAKKRLYRYVFKTVEPSVFENKYISYAKEFNVALLQQALSCFEGKHDFSFFRKTGTLTHTTNREIYQAYYKKRGAYHFIYFKANGFLRSQVRMMVQAALSCAQHELTLTQIQEQLNCQKKHSSLLASPEGLYLARIYY